MTTALFCLTLAVLLLHFRTVWLRRRVDRADR